jgi:hypothetical protein
MSLMKLGQNDGGLYAIRDPHTINAQPVRITAVKKGWFYHRAVHVKLPTGQEGILTARARKPLFGRGMGELVWLSLPTDLDSCFPAGSLVRDTFGMDTPEVTPPIRPDVRHTTMHRRAIDIATSTSPPPLRPIISSTPWVETILAEGPDVMFEVLDLDESDDCLEVISAHFFGQKLSVHSIKAIPSAPFIEISAMKTLDTIGRPYGLCLATMTPTPNKQKDITDGTSTIQADYSSCDNSKPTHLLVSTHECSYDLPSAYNMALSALGGFYPSIITGAAFAFRNGKQSVRPGMDDAEDVRGGSLFSYEIPRPKRKTMDQSMSLIGKSNVLNAPPINTSARYKKRKLDKVRNEPLYREDYSLARVASASSGIIRNREPLSAIVDSTVVSDTWEPLAPGSASQR